MTANVTVLIPTYNGAAFLRETIESLLNQSRRDFSIIVVDDASPDETVPIARSFAGRGITVVQNENRLGLAANWNRAVGLVSSPFFVLAHQDDIYEHDFLATMSPLIAARPNAFIAHCKTVSIDEHGRTIDTPAARFKETLWPPDDPCENGPASELPRLARGNYIIAPAVIFRTEAVRKIGAFDTRFRFVTDWEYWVRGSAAGYTIAGTHTRLVRFRRHPTTATRATEATLDRFREEVAMEEIIVNAARGKATLKRGTHPAIRILGSEFASRLDRGDRPGAQRLLSFARSEIPGFQNSATSMALGAALHAGRSGGKILKGLQSAAIFFSGLRARGRR